MLKFHFICIVKDNQITIKMIDESKSEMCQLPVQKEIGAQFVDGTCDKPVVADQAGLCETHFKEYLIELLYSNKIDPLPIMEWNQCKCELERNGIPVPLEEVDKVAYKNKLVQLVKEKIPLF